MSRHCLIESARILLFFPFHLLFFLFLRSFFRRARIRWGVNFLDFVFSKLNIVCERGLLHLSLSVSPHESEREKESQSTPLQRLLNDRLNCDDVSWGFCRSALAHQSLHACGYTGFSRQKHHAAHTYTHSNTHTHIHIYSLVLAPRIFLPFDHPWVYTRDCWFKKQLTFLTCVIC